MVEHDKRSNRKEAASVNVKMTIGAPDETRKCRVMAENIETGERVELDLPHEQAVRIMFECLFEAQAEAAKKVQKHTHKK